MMVPLATVLLLGIGAQWLGWRLRIPSILLLLLFGFVAGPLSGNLLLDPDLLLGETLLPFVALSVAIILLEGGMTLRWSDLRGAGGAVRNLIVLGAPITWVLATLGGRWVLGLEWMLAALIGAILVVTGPTVIIPLLRHVRPSGTVGSVARWEGIVTDPIGAILAVLVFQAMHAAHHEGDAFATALSGLSRSVAFGGLAGLIGAFVLILLLYHNLIPDFLHTSMTLAIGVGAFVLADLGQKESGLLAVTLMGIALANQRIVSVEHIVEFKENLRVLLISSLFILLAARVPIEEFLRFDLATLGFIAFLILVVRPVSVLASTWGTALSWPERFFLSWMAPRGIVAAAVASVFALELAESGHPGGDRVVSVIFGVIVVTVLVYGLTAGPVARRLGLSRGTPTGLLILGAHSWARQIARALSDQGLEILLVDTNHHEVQAARIAGLEAHYGSVLADDFDQRAPLEGLGSLLCLTANDEVNTLACIHLMPVFGRAALYQVAPEKNAGDTERALPQHLSGKVLFTEGLDFWDFQARFRTGAVIKSTKLTDEFTWEAFRLTYEQGGHPVVPLFVLREGKLRVVTAKEPMDPVAGDTLIAVVNEPSAQSEPDDPTTKRPKPSPSRDPRPSTSTP